MRRTVLLHDCGTDRERSGGECTCRQKVTRRAALGLIEGGRAAWWQRRDVNGGFVTIHYAIAIVASGWRSARMVTSRDVERAAGGDELSGQERARIECLNESTVEALAKLGASQVERRSAWTQKRFAKE